MEVWCDGAYWSQLCCLASHYSYQIDTYVPLLPQIWRLDLHLFNIGREHPPSTAASAVPTVINEALLLPRPRHRSTAMCFFASNIAQRLVIRRQLIDSYFFSSMLFGEELGRPQWGCCAVDMNAPAVMVIFVRSFNCGVFYSVPFSGQLMYHVRN